ncbi:MAG: AAC(3) family N-acetyltransferase [Actinobacteria bacterium]|nr:AAC(3) family N-acetyltransferase [Actinomycetota bacterium]MCL5069867.1 AAC(3) family N-acetyltransferase [Actinomycetota bacterium]
MIVNRDSNTIFLTMDLNKIISKTKTPITIKTLEKDFSNIGLRDGMTILLHSSLSSIGWVCGGAVAVILALENVLGPEGTLVMPAHSGDLSDPSIWENPPVHKSWWKIIKEAMPPYDCELTPTKGIGVIPEVFRKQKGVLRSNHPQVSFTAKGKNAKFIISEHNLNFGCGECSPLKKIYDIDGYVLLLGVDHLSNTSIHLAEALADYSGKEIISTGAPLFYDKKRKWVEFKDYKDFTRDFVKLGRDFVKAKHNYINIGNIGNAKSQFFKQRDLVDFAVGWLEKNK